MIILLAWIILFVWCIMAIVMMGYLMADHDYREKEHVALKELKLLLLCMLLWPLLLGTACYEITHPKHRKDE